MREPGSSAIKHDRHHLHKADGGRLFAEALAAQVETILADETGLMSAEAAVKPPSAVNVACL